MLNILKYSDFDGGGRRTFRYQADVAGTGNERILLLDTGAEKAAGDGYDHARRAAVADGHQSVERLLILPVVS